MIAPGPARLAALALAGAGVGASLSGAIALDLRPLVLPRDPEDPGHRLRGTGMLALLWLTLLASDGAAGPGGRRHGVANSD